MEVSVLQDSNYSLPDKITLNINNSEEEHSVKWITPAVDSKTTGTYIFEGSVEEYDRKVRLILTVKPKDLFQISGKEVSMNKKQKEDLDKFFTIFSVLHVGAFENSNISDEELINFGISYIDTYEWNAKVEYDANTSTAYIKSLDIDEKCMYYFEKKPTAHKSIPSYNYNSGKYSYSPAAGEGAITSQIDHLFELGDNLYKAEISTSLENSGGGYIGSGEKRSAIVRKVIENNTERYMLISYRLKGSNTSASNTTPADASADFNTWKADASSMLIENTGSHPAGYANDKNLSTAWVEGAQNDGIGEWIKLSGTNQQTLSGLRIINGYAKSSDLYGKNNRVKKI